MPSTSHDVTRTLANRCERGHKETEHGTHWRVVFVCIVRSYSHRRSCMASDTLFVGPVVCAVLRLQASQRRHSPVCHSVRGVWVTTFEYGIPVTTTETPSPRPTVHSRPTLLSALFSSKSSRTTVLSVTRYRRGDVSGTSSMSSTSIKRSV